jgi:predicted metal-binding protein
MAVTRALADAPDAAVSVREVTCLAACDHGCSAALTAPGKWSYLLGRLTLGHAADLLTYGAAYAAHATGTVLPSKRPASLRDVVLGRMPALPLPETHA